MHKVNTHPYHAAMVRRWHTNPDMSHTVDPVAYHGGRMAVLAIMLWPGDADLLESCITHDLGEVASGDVPWGGDKTTADRVADKWSAKWSLDMHIGLSNWGSTRLKFLDRADAYLWMLHNNSRLRKKKAWRDQYDWLKSEAETLGKGKEWKRLLKSL